MNKVVDKGALQGAEAVEPVTGLALLRAPFPAHQISTLPKPYKKDSPKGRCDVCGGYHGLPAVHLDYVGHAALTDRLLDADPEWLWEPMGFAQDGTPAFDRSGGLWIKLTVCGVSRLGYGNAEGKSGGDAVKEIIGDALRNAAMRFGAALDLWHKGDLHVEEEASSPNAEAAAIGILRTYADDPEGFKTLWAQNKDGWKGLLAPDAYARVVAVMKEIGGKFAAKTTAKTEPKPEPQTSGHGIPDDEIPF